MAIDFLIFWAYLLPVALMVLNYLVAPVFRWFIPSTHVIKDFSYKPTVSILLPCYNEGKHVYNTIQSIVSSNYPVENIQVLAQDDCSSDDSYEWMLKAKADFPNVFCERNPVNSGKHNTLCNAFKRAEGEIVLCIDSDCLFHPNAIAELVACFREEGIAAVGGRVGVANPNENVITQAQTMIYYLQYQLSKMLQNYTRSVFCISGCLFAIRRTCFAEIEGDVQARNWFGIHVRDGEDRFMTHQLLLRGYKTYVNVDAECWTNVPNNMRQYFMQQLRWRRGSLRDFFMTLGDLPRHAKTLNPFVVLNMLFPILVVLLWPFFDLHVLMYVRLDEVIFEDGMAYFMLYIIIGVLYNLAVRSRNREQTVRNVLLFPVIGMWFAVNMFFITLLALATFDSGDWGTRSKVKS